MAPSRVGWNAIFRDTIEIVSTEQMPGRQTESSGQWQFKYHVTESKYPFAFYLYDHPFLLLSGRCKEDY